MRPARPASGTLTIGRQSQPVDWDEKGGAAEVEVPLGKEAKTWDEFNPALQTLSVQLKGAQADDQRTVTFGLREIGAEGKQFVLNGRPAFFRGTLECCIFPLTGYPPTDVESWKRIIRVCKAHGLNLIRFHSWCPPEAAFVAADELGFYFQVECAVWTIPARTRPWATGFTRRASASSAPTATIRRSCCSRTATSRMARTAMSSWPAGSITGSSATRAASSPAARPTRNCRRISTTSITRAAGRTAGWARITGKDVQAFDVPVIVHEMGQWCVYPNFDEIRKYTGPLKPKNFDIFRDSLAEHGMLDQWRDFLRASGKLQVLCYKEEIEAALRTPGIGGFELLDLHDFPGQGTALVGVLDPFWESKGYVTPAEYRRFCSATVPLARVLKRVWTTDETFSAEVEIAHFGPAPLETAVASWKLVSARREDGGQGRIRGQDDSAGPGHSAGPNLG